MSVTREDVLKIAKLAKLQFAENEIDAFTEQFQRILAYVEKLNEVDTTGVPPTAHVVPIGGEGAFRPDVPTPSLPHDEVLAMAPDHHDGYFSVPKVIE